MSEKLENFERAFKGVTTGCRRTCECGKIFYDIENRWDWEDGELEALEANPKASAASHSIGQVVFEGREYVDACTCWHERAKKLIGFIDAHAHEIANYLTLEKQRKERIAKDAPVVQ